MLGADRLYHYAKKVFASKVASMNRNLLAGAEVEKLSLSAATTSAMPRLLAQAFVMPCNTVGRSLLGGVTRTGTGAGALGWAAWASRGVDCMTIARVRSFILFELCATGHSSRHQKRPPATLKR